MELAKWKVSLSNGETIFEGKGDFDEILGELSPWNRLHKYITENDLTITSIGIYTDDNKNFNLPSAGKTPRFGMFGMSPKPVKFSMFRAISFDMVMGQPTVKREKDKDSHFTVIEAEYEQGKLQIWVSNIDTNTSWSLFIPKKGEE